MLPLVAMYENQVISKGIKTIIQLNDKLQAYLKPDGWKRTQSESFFSMFVRWKVFFFSLFWKAMLLDACSETKQIMFLHFYLILYHWLRNGKILYANLIMNAFFLKAMLYIIKNCIKKLYRFFHSKTEMEKEDTWIIFFAHS